MAEAEEDIDERESIDGFALSTSGHVGRFLGWIQGATDDDCRQTFFADSGRKVETVFVSQLLKPTFALIFRDALAELFGNKAGEFIADY